MPRSPHLPALSWPLLLLGCTGGPATTRIDDLVGTWRLANVEIPAGARIPTLSFGADGSIAGNAGVNRYGSAADVPALAMGRWRIQPLTSTRMAGAPAAMALEQQFLRALESATAIAIRDGLLQFTNGSAVLMVLEPLRVQ
jgi:heat shock protein HslJ